MKKQSLLFSFSCLALGNLIFSNSTAAQVTADGTTNTTVNSDSNGNFTIEQGDRAGDNLFHSFGDFSVPTDGSASFNNATDISNIFSRVTGGNISNIDGLIRANDANLFLINPAGIMFGNNARLDIGGSFFGTTADSILFEDGEFSATDLDNPPLLTINAPIGLNFRDRPAPITNNSTASADFPDLNPDVTFDDNLFGLRVPDGKTFALAGGDITADGGGIVAIGGRIELGAVRGSGTLGINFENDSISFNFPDNLARANVSLTNNAGFLVSGSGGGDIAITANNIEILEGSGLFAGIFSGLGLSNARAGDITINASSLSVIGESLIDSRTSGLGNAANVFIEAQEITFSDSNIVTEVSSDGGIGDAGNINITTNSLLLQNGSSFLADTENQGDAGNIIIEARDSVVLEGIGEDGFSNQITSTVDVGTNSNVTGNAGNIEITTGSLSINDAGFISTSTFGNGNGGKITINASESVNLGNKDISGDLVSYGDLYSDVEFGAVGNSGGIEINTGSLTARNSSQITSQVVGQGNSGNIDINAEGKVSFDGRDETDSFPSAIFTSVEFGGEGNGGNINIQAESLEITNRAQFLSNVEGTGDAGDININVLNEVNLVNSDIISEVTEPNENSEGGRGEGGNINITTGSLLLQNGSSFLADTENIGDAGDINIDARGRVILEGEGPGAQSGSLEDGFIVPSQISSTVDANANPDVVGDGGNIMIETPSLTVKDNGFISATTFGNGNAGNLTISTQKLLLEGGGELGAITFSDGNAGNLTIQNAELIEIIGTSPNGTSPSGIFASAIEGSGNGGNLSISTDKLIIQDRAAIGAGNFQIVFEDIIPRSPGSGSPGTIDIKANSLELNNGGRIDAATQSETGDGANINLQVDDTIRLENNSLISAQAFGNADGGNLTIDTDFIIAFPNQTPGNGNDIIASAVDGEGGNINITAESLLGIEAGTATAGNRTNEIDASSEFGLDGTISIFIPDINPVQGVTELPNNVVTPEQTVAQACSNRNTGVASTLMVTGRGGIPSLSNAPLNSEIITIAGESAANSNNTTTIATENGNITLAKGVIKTADGQIILTPTPVAGSATRTVNGSPNCS